MGTGENQPATDTETPTVLKELELVSPRSYKRSALLYGFYQFQQWVKNNTIFFALSVLGLILCLILLRDYRREQRRYKSGRKKTQTPSAPLIESLQEQEISLFLFLLDKNERSSILLVNIFTK